MAKLFLKVVAAIIATFFLVAFIAPSESLANGIVVPQTGQSAWGAALMRDVQQVKKFRSSKLRSRYTRRTACNTHKAGSRVERCLKWGTSRGKKVCTRYLIARDRGCN